MLNIKTDKTMKKTYQIPTVKVVTVSVQPLMQASLTSTTGLEGVQTSTEEFNPSNPVDSRGSSLWDDDEE